MAKRKRAPSRPRPPKPSPPARCNGCGACCDPITHDRSPVELQIAAGQGDEEARWIIANTQPLTMREGKARFSDYEDGTTELVGMDAAGNVLHVGGAFFYACQHFDADTRQCTNYENRPPMCHDWPWAGRGPKPGMHLPTPCSFRADIGKPITPIEVVLATRRHREQRQAQPGRNP